METIVCSKTSVRNCHYSLLNSTEERSYRPGVCQAWLKKPTKAVGLFEPGTYEEQIRNSAPWCAPLCNYGVQEAPTGRRTCVRDVTHLIGGHSHKHCNLEAGCFGPETKPIPLSGSSQSVVRSFQGIHDLFPGDAWKHFCNGYLQVYYFFLSYRNNVLLKIIADLLDWAMYLFRTTVTIFNL
jgi:hypothetical protein